MLFCLIEMHTRKKYYCQVCLRAFYLEGQHIDHERRCHQDEPVIKMPRKEQLQFEHHRKMIRMSYVIYADFECLLEPLQTCEPAPATASFSKPTQLHRPSGFAMLDVVNCCSRSAPTYGVPLVYRGNNALEQFFNDLLRKEADYTQRIRQQFRDLQMNDQDIAAHRIAECCHICRKPLTDRRVADHCHVCGKYAGAAHDHCNLQYQQSNDLSVMFHNLRRYDGHLLMQHIGKIAHELGYNLDCVYLVV